MEKIDRIVASDVWVVQMGVERGLRTSIGDELSLAGYRPNMIGEFVNIEDVLSKLGMTVEETPFKQVGNNRQMSENGLVDTALRAMSGDFRRPEETEVAAFAAKIGKTIKLYSLTRDMYDGSAIYYRFTAFPDGRVIREETAK